MEYMVLEHISFPAVKYIPVVRLLGSGSTRVGTMAIGPMGWVWRGSLLVDAGGRHRHEDCGFGRLDRCKLEERGWAGDD
jgi:hypothetical protein